MLVEFTSLAAKNKSGSKDLVSSTVYPALIDSGAGGLQAPGFIVKALMDYTGAVIDASLGGPAAVPCNLSTAEASIVFGFGGKGGPQISVPLADLIDPTHRRLFSSKTEPLPACLGIRESQDDSIDIGGPVPTFRLRRLQSGEEDHRACASEAEPPRIQHPGDQGRSGIGCAYSTAVTDGGCCIHCSSHDRGRDFSPRLPGIGSEPRQSICYRRASRWALVRWALQRRCPDTHW